MPDLDSLSDQEIRDLFLSLSSKKTPEYILKEFAFFVHPNICRQFFKTVKEVFD